MPSSEVFQSSWLEEALFPALYEHHVVFPLILLNGSCLSLIPYTDALVSTYMLNIGGHNTDVWNCVIVQPSPFWCSALQTGLLRHTTSPPYLTQSTRFCVGFPPCATTMKISQGIKQWQILGITPFVFHLSGITVHCYDGQHLETVVFRWEVN